MLRALVEEDARQRGVRREVHRAVRHGEAEQRVWADGAGGYQRVEDVDPARDREREGKRVVHGLVRPFEGVVEAESIRGATLCGVSKAGVVSPGCGGKCNYGHWVRAHHKRQLGTPHTIDDETAALSRSHAEDMQVLGARCVRAALLLAVDVRPIRPARERREAKASQVGAMDGHHSTAENGPSWRVELLYFGRVVVCDEQ